MNDELTFEGEGGKRVALDDVTVIVPVRIDSPDRLRNLGLVLEWMRRSFAGVETLVVEHDVRSRAEAVAVEFGAEYVFLEADGCFHKSRVFNIGIALAGRRFVLLQDCDVLLAAGAVAEAARRLRAGDADCVYPYNGVMLQVRCDDDQPRACLDADCLIGSDVFTGASGEHLPTGVEYLNGTLVEPSTGGALLCDRRRLILRGGLNENIVSYGCEDTELETRLVKLGARVLRLPKYNCFHVYHRRGQDSHYNNFHSANLAEWRKVEAMSEAELARYVRNGFRHLKLDSRRSLTIVDAPDKFAFELSDSSKLTLDDTAFVVLLPQASAFPPALIGAMIDGLEASYDNYELHLVEQGGNRYRPVSHRDHVIYRSIPAGADADWLGTMAVDIDRRQLCVCSPFVDTGVRALFAAIEKLRGEDIRVCELPAASQDDARAARLRATLATLLPTGSASFAFDRGALAVWLGSRSPGEYGASVAENIAAAARALAVEPS